MDEEENVYILHEEINREGKEYPVWKRSNGGGSDEFDELARQGESIVEVEEDKRLIDEMLSKTQTDEGWRYLIGQITGH